ncbi:MAG: DUF6444 domain-containing protein [Leptolyngbyaceae cyanobacterium]
MEEQAECICQQDKRLNQSSKNSSKPPSSNGFGQSRDRPKKIRKVNARGAKSLRPARCVKGLYLTQSVIHSDEPAFLKGIGMGAIRIRPKVGCGCW